MVRTLGYDVRALRYHCLLGTLDVEVDIEIDVEVGVEVDVEVGVEVDIEVGVEVDVCAVEEPFDSVFGSTRRRIRRFIADMLSYTANQ